MKNHATRLVVVYVNKMEVLLEDHLGFAKKRVFQKLMFTLFREYKYWYFYSNIYGLKYDIFCIPDPCVKNPCGTNANCSVSESGERECSCPDDFPKGNPIHKCHGILPFESLICEKFSIFLIYEEEIMYCF